MNNRFKSRDLKFRAWDHDNDKMIYWTLTDLLCRFGQPEYQFGVEDRPSPFFDWMQFTGLKDKNDREVYEGDILQVKPNPFDFIKGHDYIFKVEYNEDCLTYDLLKGDDTYIDPNWLMIASDIEVLGNIYEHEYLLKNE